MVAPPPEPAATTDARASAHPPKSDGPVAKGGVRRLTSSAVRLASLQLNIWMTQLKVTAIKIGIFAGLFAVAALLALLAIIFLYIGVFHVLTDVAHIPVVWAWLIYGGFHLILAGILIMVAIRILTKKTDADDEDDDRDPHAVPHNAAASHASASKEHP